GPFATLGPPPGLTRSASRPPHLEGTSSVNLDVRHTSAAVRAFAWIFLSVAVLAGAAVVYEALTDGPTTLTQVAGAVAPLSLLRGAVGLFRAARTRPAEDDPQR